LSGEKLQGSLDPVKEELFNLILRDSYPRFLASALAKRYVNKLPLEFQDDGGVSVSGGGGTGTGGDGSGEHGSTGGSRGGGGVTSKVEVELEEKKSPVATTKSSSNLLPAGDSSASHASSADSAV
jgi:hypothetical protein